MIGSYLRRLLRLPGRLWLRTRIYASYARSFLRGRHHTVFTWPQGPIELDASVAVFIHFDRRGDLAEHSLAYVRALRDSGFAVVFVSNSGTLLQDTIEALQPLCRAILVRRNIGYDFGAIKETLDLLDLPRAETQRLLIANDSVYGPLTPLNEVLARVDFEQADLWGATESWQYRYHLQSYFLLVGRRALSSPAWRAFWAGVRQVSSKDWVIARYEVGLTQKLLRAGLRCRPLWRYQDLLDQAALAAGESGVAEDDPIARMRVLATQRIRAAAVRLAPLNPTAELWRHLLLAGFPFLKIELLRDNPTNIPDIADWRNVLAALPSANIALIERDLQQKVRNRAP